MAVCQIIQAISMYKVSIIIPVYNSAAYMERCLQSVWSQTLRDIEVLLIDNCGRDDSIAIAKAFISRQARTDIAYRIAATPTTDGPAQARNLGLQLAQGEYVAFLDADDWVEKDMYELLYTNARSADMSCGNIWQDFESGAPSRILTNPVMPQGELTKTLRRRLLKTFVSYFTTYIYRREWLLEKGIMFPSTRSAEDSSYLTCCLLSANRIAQTDKPLYHYVMHAGSLTSRRVWKGADKRRAFGAVMDYARRQGLMRDYRWQLYYIYVKKALLVPILEML